MGIFLIRRMLTLAATLAATSILVFLVLDVLPGNAAQMQLGAEATPDTLAALTRKLGLDRPAPERYVLWVSAMAQGDFGLSSAYETPVAQLIADSMQVSLPLAFLAMALTIALALALGITAAARHNQPADMAIMACAQIGMAVPNFWFGILLILVFAVHLHWFAAGGFPGWQAGFGPAMRALLLPAWALALVQAAILARVTRSSVLEVLGEDFVRTARAKGLSRAQVLWRHVLRNALAPIVTIIGLQFSSLIASAVVIENVFALPGLGRLIFQAIGNRDANVVRDGVLLLAGLVVVVNFCVDVASVIIDPRLKVRGL